MGVLDVLDDASAPEGVVEIIMDAKLQAEWDIALGELEKAAVSDKNRSMADLPASNKAIDNLDEIRERVMRSVVLFHVRSMQWYDRVGLEAEHPPRPDSILDMMQGYNVETFVPALIRRSVYKMTDPSGDVVEPVPEYVWEKLLGIPSRLETAEEPPQAAVPGVLNYKSVDRLSRECNRTNENEPSVPPSARSFLGSQDSGASLAQPGPGTPPPSDSADGSPASSPKSSTTRKRAPSKARSTATSPPK